VVNRWGAGGVVRVARTTISGFEPDVGTLLFHQIRERITAEYQWLVILPLNPMESAKIPISNFGESNIGPDSAPNASVSVGDALPVVHRHRRTRRSRPVQWDRRAIRS